MRLATLGLVQPKPSREEIDHRNAVRFVRQTAWPRCVRIVVASPKGGVGKTPTSVTLGGVLAQVRGGGVVIWDAADSAGTLGLRVEGRQAVCISEIAADPDRFGTPGLISQCAATQSSFADVVASVYDREFGATEVRHLNEAFARSYRVSVADSGNVEHSDGYRELVSTADLLVIPTTVTQDSVRKALGLIGRLHDGQLTQPQQAPPYLVVVTNNGGPTTPTLAAEIHRIFEEAGAAAVVDVPFDPELAPATPITIGNLSHASTVAWTQVAAAAVANLAVRTDAPALVSAR